ncbi:MAG: hypothetical protein LUD81_01155 [Clostridiales bacterium]|nr:hypothetical protein [Clostridiales bacterium]
MAVIELDGVKYEVMFDGELKIDLPAKRYEFFCYGVCPPKNKHKQRRRHIYFK